jgi:hypothetical protein
VTLLKSQVKNCQFAKTCLAKLMLKGEGDTF